MVTWLTDRLSMVGNMDLGSVAIQPLPRSPTTGRDRRGRAFSAHHALPCRLDTNDGVYDVANHAAVTRGLSSLDSTPTRAFPTYGSDDYRLSQRVDGVRCRGPRV